MNGLAAVYSVAPRVLALLAFSAVFVVGSVLSQPELLMRTALTAQSPTGPIHYDEIVDQPDLDVSKLLAADRVDQDAQSPRLLTAGLYSHVSPGDRISVTLSGNKLGLMDVTDVQEMGKLIIPGSKQQEARHYLLLTGQIVGDDVSSGPVRLIVDAHARPPFSTHETDDRRSL